MTEESRWKPSPAIPLHAETQFVLAGADTPILVPDLVAASRQNFLSDPPAGFGVNLDTKPRRAVASAMEP